jgi:hypothetical protein
MALDPKLILQRLDEVESELFEAADDNDCQRFHRNSQLTAVLLLLFANLVVATLDAASSAIQGFGGRLPLGSQRLRGNLESSSRPSL